MYFLIFKFYLFFCVWKSLSCKWDQLTTHAHAHIIIPSSSDWCFTPMYIWNTTNDSYLTEWPKTCRRFSYHSWKYSFLCSFIHSSKDVTINRFLMSRNNLYHFNFFIKVFDSLFYYIFIWSLKLFKKKSFVLIIIVIPYIPSLYLWPFWTKWLLKHLLNFIQIRFNVLFEFIIF